MRIIADFNRSKTLEGCVIVMSGLVPLGVDLMRYNLHNLLKTPLYKSQFRKLRYRFLWHGAHISPYRSEIALQAISFGATIHTK